MWQTSELVHLDILGAIMVALVSIIAWMIFDYSRIYLAGEMHLKRHFFFFIMTIASAIVVAIANDLIVLTFFWSLTSIAVQRLLLFYPERVFAQIAVRKKFILDRIADLAMICCIVEIAGVFHTTSLRSIMQIFPTIEQGNAHVAIAALCVVIAVSIRCAQIPFHGWIIQVMEAPTPVSALLHAGVVNIGGFVLLRLAPIIEGTSSAGYLLIIIGGCSLITAALVMTTRVSIKVTLAWSTCAQMGCMLLEAGIGAYPLVLIHLIGHSLYKSYAFLHAGNSVELTRIFAQTPTLKSPPLLRSQPARLLFIVLAACIGWFAGMYLTHDPSLAIGMLLASLAIMHLFTLGAGDKRLLSSLIAGSAAILALYILSERIATGIIPHGAIEATNYQVYLAGAIFIILAFLEAIIVRDPSSPLSSRLYDAAFAGFYLDELFTRSAMPITPRSSRKAS